MNTDIQAEEQFEMETQVQATVTETDLLAECGFSSEGNRFITFATTVVPIGWQ